MHNFEFEHEGKKLWYSRSLACSVVVLRYDTADHTIEILATKRGQGCEYNKGKWNVPGGFIDFNENAKQCAIRECWEETGIRLPDNQVMFQFIDTEPKGARQTIVAMFSAIFPKTATTNWVTTSVYSEPEEVDTIEWINLKDLDKYDWLRGQKENINRIVHSLDWVTGS